MGSHGSTTTKGHGPRGLPDPLLNNNAQYRIGLASPRWEEQQNKPVPQPSLQSRLLSNMRQDARQCGECVHTQTHTHVLSWSFASPSSPRCQNSSCCNGAKGVPEEGQRRGQCFQLQIPTQVSPSQRGLPPGPFN